MPAASSAVLLIKSMVPRHSDSDSDSGNNTVVWEDDGQSTDHLEYIDVLNNTVITVPIMPLESFHLFPALPNELQLLIWIHAIGHLRLDLNFLRHLSNSRSGRFLRLGRSELITYATRSILMATCRLSRLLALQAMRNDIACIWISLAFPKHKVEHLQLSQWSVLKVVDGCIEEVKARMESKPFTRGLGIIIW